MKFAKIKNIKTKISRICLGTWGLGSSTKKTPSYGKISSKRAKEILIDAYKKKINFFDTAGVYGGGKSEDLIGEVFSPVRTKVIIATKVGCYDFNQHCMNHDMSKPCHRFAIYQTSIYLL